MAKETNSTFNLGGDAGVGAAQDEGGLVFDLTGVQEDKKFELIPKGTYSAVVDDLTFGDSSKNNPMITVVYSITDPEYENRKLYDFWVLAGDGAEFGLGKLKKFLTRVCPEVSITGFSPKTFADGGVAVGRECQITLKIQTQKSGDYKGEKRNQVADVLAPSNSGSFLG